MRRTHRQPKLVGGDDRRHRRDFGRRALAVGQVVLADLLAHRHHDPLPADHGAQAQRERDRDLHPGRDELGGQVDVLLVIGQNLLSSAVNLGLPDFCTSRSASLTTYMSLRRLPTRLSAERSSAA